MAKPVILVSGATGHVGQATLAALQQQHAGAATVRAGVRDVERSRAKLGALGAELVHVDPAQPATLDAAFRGVDALFVVTPGSEDRAALAIAQVQAAKRAGVKYVLVVSVYAVGVSGEHGQILFARQFRPIEAETAASGLSYGLLRLPFFIENNFAFLQSAKSEHKLYSSVNPDAMSNAVSVADIGAVAAEILVHPAQHHNKTYTLTASRAVSLREFAAALGAANGVQYEVVTVPHAAAEQAMVGMGFPAWQAHGIVELNEALNAGAGADVTDDVERITGKKAVDQVQWAAQVAGAFKA